MVAMQAAASEARKIEIVASLTEAQRDVWESPARFTWMSGGYGSGKSWLLALWAVREAFRNVGMVGGLVGPSYPMLRRSVLPLVFEHLETHGIEYAHKVANHEIVIEPGVVNSTIQIGSADNPGSLKGPTWAWLGVDEPGECPREIPGRPGTTWDVLLSRLRHPRGVNQAVLTGTPEGVESWISETFERGPHEMDRREAWQRDYRVVYADTRSNPYLPAGYVESLMQLDPTTRREKVEGRATARVGGVAYHAFDRANHERPTRYERHRGEMVVGMDFNVDPICAVLMQFNQGHIYVFGELVLRNSNTLEMARAIIRRCETLGVRQDDVAIYPDPSGGARSTKGRSDIDILKAAGFKRIRRHRAAPAQKDRVNAVNAMLHHGRIDIDPSCTVLSRDLAMVKTRQGTFDLDKRDRELTHASDAMGYAVEYEFPVRRPMLRSV